MKIEFKNLTLTVESGKVRLNGYARGIAGNTPHPIVALQIAGRDHVSNVASKTAQCSETDSLCYASHEIKNDVLTLTQRNDICEVTTVFRGFADTNTLQIQTSVKNISAESFIVETLSAFLLGGLFDGCKGVEKTYFTKFCQGHHAECQPRRISLYEHGFNAYTRNNESRIAYKNEGSWSSKEQLPQGIIEHGDKFVMFQIESNCHWQYELAANNGALYLYLGGAGAFCGNESISLEPGQSVSSPAVALAYGDSLGGMICEMTKYRRYIAGKCAADENLPVIFNEYMHASWDSPVEENTRVMARAAAKVGAEYYVIDCGWHNEEPGNSIYPYVGQWQESKARFPHGVRATTDYIRSLGLKAGLWIEPEIIGVKCNEMLSYYDEDCFLHRGGKRIAVMGRHFLNFRAKKVTHYLTETLRRMIDDYGAQYIKMDYNEDMGFADESVTADRAAYLNWIDVMRAKFPNVIIETCSSGGMRMDYQTLRHFPLVSTSDQTDYRLYPYIAANILSAVLPEQAAVWNYPVVGEGIIGELFAHGKEWVQENISDEQIVMNTINALLGRMHLASHIELLSDKQFALMKEGISYYNALTPIKKNALPYFPLGFTRFGFPYAACGLKDGNKIYLAVWNLGGEQEVRIPVPEGIKSVKVGYPLSLETKYAHTDSELVINFIEKCAVRFFEIETRTE